MRALSFSDQTAGIHIPGSLQPLWAFGHCAYPGKAEARPPPAQQHSAKHSVVEIWELTEAERGVGPIK